MSNEYGSDYITIADEDGTEFELEVLTTIEYDGCEYLAVTLASLDEDEQAQVELLKSVDEDGDSILCAIEDEAEYVAVYSLMMDKLYEEEEE